MITVRRVKYKEKEGMVVTMSGWKSAYNKKNKELEGRYKEKHHLRSFKEVYIMLAIAIVLIVLSFIFGD